MRNTIIVAVLLFIAVVVASVFYFGNLGQDSQQSVGPVRHLPADTYFVTSFANDDATDNIFKDFQIFEAIIGKGSMAQWTRLKRDLLRNPKIAPLMDGADIFLSFHPLDDNIAPVFSISTTEEIDQRTLDQTLLTISERYTVTTLDTADIRLYELRQSPSPADTTASSDDSDKQDHIFYITYIDGSFFASYHPATLLQIGNAQVDKFSPEQIEYLKQHRNRNSAFGVFLPQQNIPSLVSAIKRSPAGDFLRPFTSIGGQTVWNINFRQDALMLTGETNLDADQDHYLSLFAGQRKISQPLYRYFPESTMLYTEYSFSDAKTWFEELEAWQTRQDPSNNLSDQAVQIEKDHQNLLTDFQETLGHNFALVEQANSSYLGFFNIQDSTKFDNVLHAIAQNSGEGVYRFRYSKLPYRFYGDAFQAFDRPYFARIGQVVVMANHQSTLVTYLRNWNRKNLLIGTVGFKNQEQIQGNDANVTFFINRKLADQLISNQLKSDYLQSFRDSEEHGFHDFYGWSLQLSGNENGFISRFNATYKSKDRLGANEQWTYPMKSRLINGPYVFDYNTTEQFILAQEQNHTVHAMEPTGDKLWSAVFSGRIVGEVQQLEDRSLLLVTDRRRLYRFDTEGHTLDGFSTSLPSEPSAQPTVVHGDEKQLIAIPARNSIMVYDMEGGPVPGWDNVHVEGRILGPILQIENHLVVSTTFGRVYFYDMDGNRIKEIDLPGDVTFLGAPGLVQAENQQTLYQADNTGTIYRIQTDGSSRIVLKDTTWNDNYEITFQNITGGTAPEMIVTEGANLRVYQLGDTLTSVYDYAFTQTINDSPLFFPASGGLKQLGIALSNNNLVYLLDQNGQLLEGFPVESLPIFYYGAINYNSGNYLLTAKRDFKIYAYPH